MYVNSDGTCERRKAVDVIIELVFQAKQREEQQVACRSKKEDIEVMSTTALILENRPM